MGEAERAPTARQDLAFETPDGLKLAAHAYGRSDAPAVLFAHGGGQTRHAWGKAAEILASHDRYAVTLDLRGHGDSDWSPHAQYGLDHYAGDLVAVAEALGGKPDIVGASLGGLSAMVVEGMVRPGTFSSLTLVDITPRMEQSGVDEILGFMAEKMGTGFASLDEAADFIASYLPHRERPKDLSGLTKNLRLNDDGRYRWHWDPAFVTHSTTARQVKREDMLDQIASNVKLPTHLIRGRMSNIVSQASVDHFMEVVPHASYTDISEAGHMVAGDKNDIFISAVLEFLQKGS